MSAMTSRRVAPVAVSLVSPPVTSRRAPGKRTVTGMTSLPERGAEVALSPISDQHDDTAGFFPRDRDGCRDRRAAGDADDRPGRTDPCDEVGHASCRLLPDLGARPELMSQGVGWIGVLVDVHIAVPVGGRHSLRLADGTVGPLERIGEHELGAERADDSLALDRDPIRHTELERMAAHRADHPERDAGVATRRVEDRPATAQASLLF